MSIKDREPHPMAYTRMEALRGNIAAIREGKQITPEAISSLFHSSRAVAQDVMGLTSVASTLFSMRFGTMMLASAIFRDVAVIEHLHDNIGNETRVLNSPSELRRTMGRYLFMHFCFYPFPDPPYRPRLITDLRNRFTHAGITTDYVDGIHDVAAGMAHEICANDVQLELDADRSVDQSKLTVEFFSASVAKIPERPSFVLDEKDYPEFMKQTGAWLHKRFEDVLDNVLTGKYLTEQEMS